MYDPSKYEERQARNELSRQYATHDGQPWTDEDDNILLLEWVKPGPQKRD